MGNILPLFFTLLTGACLGLTFYAVWRSLRGLLGEGLAATDSDSPVGAERRKLLDEKHALLQGLRDLEQERDVGKVSQDDFDAVNARLRSRAREVMKLLDAQVAPYRAQAEALVEKAGGGAKVEPAAPVEAPATIRQAPAASTPASCGKCHTVNEADAVFCKKCGDKLQAAAEVSA